MLLTVNYLVERR